MEGRAPFAGGAGSAGGRAVGSGGEASGSRQIPPGAPDFRHFDFQQRQPSGGDGDDDGRRREKKVFDVFSWYPNYQSCQRYFLEVAQFEYACQALAAFLNIKLPYQRLGNMDFKQYQLASNAVRGVGVPPPFRQPPVGGQHISPHLQPLGGGGGQPGAGAIQSVDYLTFGNVSLLPYIRRLVVTGYDADGIMHGWFGDDWMRGLNPLLESERQNYMFAAKSSDWLALKKAYDTVTEECVPFLVPLQRATEPEIVRAEEAWGNVLSMRDWMIGPRSMDAYDDGADVM